MKTLILNGSPRKSGDTTALICAFTRYLQGEYRIIDCYFTNIDPCMDCRCCREKLSCPINDKMQEIYDYLADYKGHTYLTYHDGNLPGGGGFDRSMCIEEMYYDADGRIKEISHTDNGPKQIESLNPYQRNEAETICWEEGVETENCSAGGRNVCDMQNGEYIKVSGVDFGAGAQKFKVSASTRRSQFYRSHTARRTTANNTS